MMNHSIQRILVQRTLIFLTMAAACPSATAYPAYVLELVNGNAITISEFWEERGEIKFRARGGIIGIARDRVREIRFCEAPPDLFEEDTQPSIASPMAPDIIGSAAERRSKTAGIKETRSVTVSTIEDMKRQKSDLEMNRDEALKQFRNAAKNRDAAGKRKAMTDLLKASHGLDELIETMERNRPNIFED